MRKYLISISAILSLAVFEARAQKQKEVDYEFPSTMSDPVKAEYLRQFEKGKVLYAINCGKCHNQKVKRKELIPDFTLDELMSYEIRVSNARHEGNMTEVHVTTEELGYIITFLSYKKKSGIPMKKESVEVKKSEN